MRASACARTPGADSGVTPEPTRTGSVPAAPPRDVGGWWARRWRAPVTMTPSAPKNSAASAASARETSAVRAWEACFFLRSAKTGMCSAPI